MGKSGQFTLMRRALVAIGTGFAVTAAIRMRVTEYTPPQKGGWRELRGEDLR